MQIRNQSSPKIVPLNLKDQIFDFLQVKDLLATAQQLARTWKKSFYGVGGSQNSKIIHKTREKPHGVGFIFLLASSEKPKKTSPPRAFPDTLSTKHIFRKSLLFSYFLIKKALVFRPYFRKL